MTIHEELEILVGKLLRGNITPTVYDLIKSSPYKFTRDSFRKELKECAGNQQTTCSAVDISNRVSDFESFLGNCKRV